MAETPANIDKTKIKFNYENLKKLRDKFKADEKPITYNPQMLFEKNIIKELDELVDYFEKHIKT